MARKLASTLVLDDLEDECMFTTAALQADENSSDLVSETVTWIDSITAVRDFDRQIRQVIANTDASRSVANANLDRAIVAFGDDLYLACGKDRSSSRWGQFFTEPVSSFIKVALVDELKRVQGWLSSASDEVLETHRDVLKKWADATDTALTATAGLSSLRKQVWLKRENLTSELTAARDHLQASLEQRARDRGLPRDWPKTFFRTTKASSETAPETTSTL